MIGSVYKIVSKDENINEIYVGSSVNFKSRLQSHKCDCYNVKRNNYNSKVYQFIREHGGWDNWNMIKIIDIDCEDKSELRYYEQLYISSLKPKLNCNKSYTTEDDRKEYFKEHYQQNKDKIKEYNEKNKEKIKENMKEYYQQNKDKLKEKTSVKINCECGGKYTRHNKSAHFKSKKHLNNS